MTPPTELGSTLDIDAAQQERERLRWEEIAAETAPTFMDRWHVHWQEVDDYEDNR